MRVKTEQNIHFIKGKFKILELLCKIIYHILPVFLLYFNFRGMYIAFKEKFKRNGC